jgi:hypothetical protein
MEREPSESIVREMVTHLKYLSMEASCHGFDKARALHSSILTDMEDGLYGWLQKEKVSDARKNFVMPSGNCSQESVKILTVTLVKVMLVQTGSSNLKGRHKVSLQPSHVTITISGSAGRRQTMRQVIYSGDIFAQSVYRRAMWSEAVCGKRF